MTVRVGYTTVYVTDFEAALAFYRDTLGLPLRFSDEKFSYAAFSTGGADFSVAGLAGDHPEREQLVARDTGIGLVVDDLTATYEAWQQRGVRFSMPPTKQAWGGTIAVFADPEGNRITLDEYLPEAH